MRGLSIVTISLALLSGAVFAQSAATGKTSSVITQCFSGQGYLPGQIGGSSSCSDLKAEYNPNPNYRFIIQPLRVGSDYDIGFNYSSTDLWQICRKTDGRSSMRSGTYCKYIKGQNQNFWVPGLGPMTAHWVDSNTSPVSMNTYHYDIFTASLPEDNDFETNLARQNKICRDRGFGDVIGAIQQRRYRDVFEGGIELPVVRTNDALPSSAGGRNERILRRAKYHQISCNADAYIAVIQRQFKPRG